MMLGLRYLYLLQHIMRVYIHIRRAHLELDAGLLSAHILSEALVLTLGFYSLPSGATSPTFPSSRSSREQSLRSVGTTDPWSPSVH